MTRIRRSAWPGALVLGATLTGCAGLESGRGPAPDPAQLARAYQDGVRDALAQLSREHGPDAGSVWTPPVVQEVWIPARLVDAVLIPAHREWVVIHPAEWARRPRLTPTFPPPSPRPQP